MTVKNLEYVFMDPDEKNRVIYLFFVEWGAHLHNFTWLFLFTSVHVHTVVPASFFPPWTSLSTLSWYRLFLVAMEAGDREYHTVENWPFYASHWCSTISGRKIATLYNVGFL